MGGFLPQAVSEKNVVNRRVPGKVVAGRVAACRPARDRIAVSRRPAGRLRAAVPAVADFFVEVLGSDPAPAGVSRRWAGDDAARVGEKVEASRDGSFRGASAPAAVPEKKAASRLETMITDPLPGRWAEAVKTV